MYPGSEYSRSRREARSNMRVGLGLYAEQLGLLSTSSALSLWLLGPCIPFEAAKVMGLDDFFEEDKGSGILQRKNKIFKAFF
jgi:hypothetical protein